MLHLVNKYMDTYRADEKNLVAKAKAEKYSKIIAKTIINASGENYGQNQFFYDAAEGLLTAVILLIAEYLPPKKVDGKLVDCRHIVSVFKIVQELIAPSRVKGKSQFQLLMEQLPSDHKTKWFAGAALNSVYTYIGRQSAESAFRSSFAKYKATDKLTLQWRLSVALYLRLFIYSFPSPLKYSIFKIMPFPFHQFLLIAHSSG